MTSENIVYCSNCTNKFVGCWTIEKITNKCNINIIHIHEFFYYATSATCAHYTVTHFSSSVRNYYSHTLSGEGGAC